MHKRNPRIRTTDATFDCPLDVIGMGSSVLSLAPVTVDSEAGVASSKYNLISGAI